MKKIVDPGNYSISINLILFINRLMIGSFMLVHGIGKFSKLTGTEPIKFADPIGIGEPASLAATVFAEVFCSVLLIVGLGTRLAAIPLIITMLVAAFIIHADDPFGKKELALIYLLAYVTIAVAGAGKYSIDHLIYGKLNNKRS